MTEVTLTPEELQTHVDEQGGVDKAAKAMGLARDPFREACRLAGVKGVNKGGARTSALSVVGEPVSREEILESEVKELRRYVREDRNTEVVAQRLVELAEKMIGPKAARYSPAPREKTPKRTPHSFLLEWSDLHASEVVDAEQVNFLNAFNWEIMLQRHERMRQGILSFKENRPYSVERLHIGAIGDMVTGDIHDELRVTNEKVLVDAVFQLGLDMGEWIESLIPEFPEIVIDTTFGNHGRRTQKPAFKNAFDNWDWLFYNILKIRLAHYPSVTVNISRAAQVPVMIYDKRILLWHGDGVKSTMVDVPWGGIIRYCKKLSDTWRLMRQPIDHFAIGHWHEANQIRAGWILMNGSVKGPDEFSLGRFGGGQPAQQVLATFHPRRGLTETCILDLGEVR